MLKARKLLLNFNYNKFLIEQFANNIRHTLIMNVWYKMVYFFLHFPKKMIYFCYDTESLTGEKGRQPDTLYIEPYVNKKCHILINLLYFMYCLCKKCFKYVQYSFGGNQSFKSMQYLFGRGCHKH